MPTSDNTPDSRSLEMRMRDATRAFDAMDYVTVHDAWVTMLDIVAELEAQIAPDEQARSALIAANSKIRDLDAALRIASKDFIQSKD